MIIVSWSLLSTALSTWATKELANVMMQSIELLACGLLKYKVVGSNLTAAMYSFKFQVVITV